nr:MAG TPA: hypothetical protein [Caudoviricetes sp.]
MCEEHRRAKRGLRLVSFCVPNCDQIDKSKTKTNHKILNANRFFVKLPIQKING